MDHQACIVILLAMALVDLSAAAPLLAKDARALSATLLKNQTPTSMKMVNTEFPARTCSSHSKTEGVLPMLQWQTSTAEMVSMCQEGDRNDLVGIIA